MNYRNTKQKSIILEVIKESKHHPTISEIYEEAQKIDPSIGLATVYRNVKKFVNDKQVFQIKTKSGTDRYDYCTDHIHFECLRCGKIIDILDDELLKTLSLKFQNRPEYIKKYNLMLEGYCESCKRGSNEEEISL